MRTLSVTPLTHSQLGIYLEYAENPGSLMYNTPFFFRFTFTPDTDRLKRAIIEAVNSHPSSGIIVRTENGVPCDRETYSIFDAKADEAALEEPGGRS